MSQATAMAITSAASTPSRKVITKVWSIIGNSVANRLYQGISDRKIALRGCNILYMPRWLNRNVWGMTLTSLLSDACYEMVLAVLPGFLPVIHVAAAALGWIEGASDAFSSFLKLFAGWYSDKIGRRKRMIVLGYFFTGTGLSIFSTARHRGFPFCWAAW